MFRTAIAGSLPKPAWLAETEKLWPQWKAQGPELQQAKADATLLWIKVQEDAGLEVIGDGEQARQHFVHGFVEQVEGIDFENKVKMGIRNNRYDAMVPQVVAPLRLKGRVHAFEARLTRAHTTKKVKFTLPGPMTIVDTVADRFYGDKVKMAMAFAELLNQEALALQADGVDIVQFDEPGFNVYMQDAVDWGVQALEIAARGALQGLTLGGGDEMTAAFGALSPDLTYDQVLKAERDKIALGRQDNPWAAYGGEVAGAVALPLGAVGPGKTVIGTAGKSAARPRTCRNLSVTRCRHCCWRSYSFT